MPESEYEKLPGTVLAQKKAQQVGRFNPKAPEIREMKMKEMVEEVRKRSKSFRIPRCCRMVFQPPLRVSAHNLVFPRHCSRGPLHTLQ